MSGLTTIVNFLIQRMVLATLVNFAATIAAVAFVVTTFQTSLDTLASGINSQIAEQSRMVSQDRETLLKLVEQTTRIETSSEIFFEENNDKMSALATSTDYLIETASGIINGTVLQVSQNVGSLSIGDSVKIVSDGDLSKLVKLTVAERATLSVDVSSGSRPSFLLGMRVFTGNGPQGAYGESDFSRLIIDERNRIFVSVDSASAILLKSSPGEPFSGSVLTLDQGSYIFELFGSPYFEVQFSFVEPPPLPEKEQ